ncbi:MAG: ATPase [Symbiobacteriaceae bacterium]|jgi:N-acetylglucosamine kinase-like BadF-type ATPase|nr:ATPase [Symbiobacteriaceae bacterium]
MPYFLGVDGGNSKTFALVGDHTGRLLALGKGGPSNHQAKFGVDGAMAVIAEAVEQALSGAGLSISDITHASFCLAGADYPSDYDLLSGAIRQRWPKLKQFSVHNDSFAGLRAGTSRSWGVVSVCGTGTNQCGIGKDGRELQIGGMGYIWGDHGGGGDLGREAVRAAFMADEKRGPATSLVQVVLDHFGCKTTPELSYAIYTRQWDGANVHRLAPKVFAEARKGDQVAQEILVRMGTLLGQSVSGVIRELNLTDEAVDVVMAGSTWKGETPIMVDAFRLAVHRVAPRAKLVRPRYEPIVGSWLLAVEKAGNTVDQAIYSAIEASMPQDLSIYQEEA